MNRRAFLLGSARLAAWYGVLELGAGARAWAQGVEPVIRKWMKELAEICAAVEAGTLAPPAWQTAIERLHASVPLEEIIRFVDLEAALARIRAPERKLGAVEDVRWPGAGPGLPRFGHKLFVYRKGACTPPHAHNHLVSAHLVLKGQIRARTFNRLQDLERSILIQPTGDRTLGPGHTVSMSDDRDNVHWFEGASDVSVSFDVPVGDISPGKAYRQPAEVYNQIYLDPTVAARADGRIEAPILKFRESVQKFG
ncbi:MAG TPA: hypothetical protein VND93_05855 [Myxococcales bacterium]|nr:hypothetical protein [Myxococcales bacterium]